MPAQADRPLLVLGLESSCDDTAAAVLRVGDDVEILSSLVRGQDGAHAPYGGVVPEIAARAHGAHLPTVCAEALRAAGISAAALDLVAATAGPGLIGGVMAGLTFAKGLSLAAGVPLVPVNHLAGHALSVGLTPGAPTAPYLLLLVSGGHTQLLVVEDDTQFRRIGTTIDDAAGEAFDKTAKLLGLDGTGGAAVEAAAKSGNPDRFAMPSPLKGRPGCDFSFSGLKTALRQEAAAAGPDGTLPDRARADLAAAFQKAAVGHLARQSARAMDRDDLQGIREIVAAGGVAANSALRHALEDAAASRGWRLTVPPLSYCTDNAAMIALAGARLYQAQGEDAVDRDLGFPPRARWPLDMRDGTVTLGGGRKGRKA